MPPIAFAQTRPGTNQLQPQRYLRGVFTVDRDNQEKKSRFKIEQLEERIAPSSANFPPGQFPSGNPAHAPGNSNPNENGGPKK